jgi:hypothetical protein
VEDLEEDFRGKSGEWPGVFINAMDSLSRTSRAVRGKRSPEESAESCPTVSLARGNIINPLAHLSYCMKNYLATTCPMYNLATVPNGAALLQLLSILSKLFRIRLIKRFICFLIYSVQKSNYKF